ncbi:MAG TPA: DNA repair and recombination protein RadA [Thermoplasmata archaeon]|nr:DNA repair and recombination protein RadA [Thermoplasmata archaeon]
MPGDEKKGDKVATSAKGVEELPGVGPATAEKLREAGYTDLMSIAVASPDMIAEATEIGSNSAQKIIAAARDAVDVGSFETGDVIAERRKSVAKLTTCSKAFDELLGGGLETQAITECYGEFGSGKCVTGETPVLYFNDEHAHFESIGETYAKYAVAYGEVPFEEGFVVRGAPIQVMGLPAGGLRKTLASAIYREFAEKVYRVRTSRGAEHRVTGAHRFLSVTDHGVQWLPAAKLSVGDPIAAPKELPLGDGALPEEDAYFLGLFVAEGTANPLSICNTDPRIINWLLDYIERRFSYAPTVRRDSARPHVKTVLLRIPTKQFLGDLANARAGDKRVPEAVLAASKDAVRSFLGGYFDGDGSVGRTISATTKSKTLAHGLAYLFGRLGIRVSRSVREHDGVPYHVIHVVGFDRDAFDLPMLTKDRWSGHARSSAHGYPTRIPSFLAGVYRRTLGGNTGRRRKPVGRAANDAETFYHVLTRSRYARKTLNEVTYRRIVAEFVAGYERLARAHDLVEHLESLTQEEFTQLVSLLPFAFRDLSQTTSLSKSALQNYTYRHLPEDVRIRRILRQALLAELGQRMRGLEEAFPQIKNIHSLAWDEVVSIEEESYGDFVYDFVIPDGHAFVGGPIPTFMHNSQLAHQLAVNVTRAEDEGGLNGDTVWIDTESTFRPERIRQMADALELDADEILKRLHVARAFNSHHQMLLMEKANEMTKDFPIRLVVVDSLTAHFRAEYIGRGVLAERQQLLNKHIHELMRFGDVHNAAIYVTNQVHAKPDAFFGDPTRPVGGHIVGHSATFRVYLRKSKGGKRIARLIDSPNLPEAEAVFSVSEDGIRD